MKWKAITSTNINMNMSTCINTNIPTSMKTKSTAMSIRMTIAMSIITNTAIPTVMKDIQAIMITITRKTMGRTIMNTRIMKRHPMIIPMIE